MQQQLDVDGSTLVTVKPLLKRPPMRWKLWSRRVGVPYLFLLPFLLLFIFFFLVPLGYALWTSLFADRLVGGTVFVGTQNFQMAFKDANFWEGVRNVLLLLVVQVPIMLGLALILSLLLDSR